MEKQNLKEEGITKEFLKTIDISAGRSHVQLRQGENPVKLLSCNSGYWVSLGDGEFLRDEQSRLVVISKDEALIGRARYIINFKEELENAEIHKEVEKLKRRVDSKLKNLMPQMRNVLLNAGVIEPEEGLEKTLLSALGELGTDKAKRCKELATESFVSTYNRLVELQANEDYDSLYMMLFQNGLPELLSVKNNDLSSLVKFFHRDNIEETIKNIAGKSHLENLAMFNLEKRKKSNI